MCSREMFSFCHLYTQQAGKTVGAPRVTAGAQQESAVHEGSRAEERCGGAALLGVIYAEG